MDVPFVWEKTSPINFGNFPCDIMVKPRNARSPGHRIRVNSYQLKKENKVSIKTHYKANQA